MKMITFIFLLDFGKQLKIVKIKIKNLKKLGISK